MSALRGKRVLVTRPKGQAGVFADKLSALGATPILLPAIQIVPLENCFELDQALLHLENFDWVVFTSVNGVEARPFSVPFTSVVLPSECASVSNGKF